MLFHGCCWIMSILRTFFLVQDWIFLTRSFIRKIGGSTNSMIKFHFLAMIEISVKIKSWATKNQDMYMRSSILRENTWHSFLGLRKYSFRPDYFRGLFNFLTYFTTFSRAKNLHFSLVRGCPRAECFSLIWLWEKEIYMLHYIWR